MWERKCECVSTFGFKTFIILIEGRVVIHFDFVVRKLLFDDALGDGMVRAPVADRITVHNDMLLGRVIRYASAAKNLVSNSLKEKAEAIETYLLGKNFDARARAASRSHIFLGTCV